MDPNLFRKVNHKQGIKWIKYINHDVNVSLLGANVSQYSKPIRIFLNIKYESDIKIRNWNTFPDEDFCIYVDFPFNQLVIVSINFYGHNTAYICMLKYVVKREFHF